MGSINKVITKSLFVIATVICVVITFNNINDVPLNTNGTIYLVDKYVDTYYEMLSENVGLTTINGISNVYINMESEGYSIYKEDITKNYIDVSFTKEGCPSYRYYFTYPECKITVFSSEYENSYLGVSYIIERKE